MKPIKKVEVIHKLTESQIREARVDDLAERIAKQDIEILELRNRMIKIRKEFEKFEGRIGELEERITKQDNTISDLAKQPVIVTEVVSDSCGDVSDCKDYPIYKDYDPKEDKHPQH